MIVSFSGIKEKLRIILEAAIAHCCLSALPSSSLLNKPSSSNQKLAVRFFVTLDSSVFD
jgi:hypothetical protein